MRRRFRRRPSLVVLIGAALALLAAVRLAVPRLPGAASADFAGIAPNHHGILIEGPCRILDVEPGYILRFEQRRQDPDGGLKLVRGSVRLLGVRSLGDSPGLAGQPRATAAQQFTSEFIGQGPQALRLDKRRIDEEGRFLAYLEVNGQTLNVELVRAGLALADTRPGDSEAMSRLLRRAQTEARQARRGIWAAPRSIDRAGR